MSGARRAMLGAIRASLGRGALSPEQTADLDRRLNAPQPNLVPARGRRDRGAMVELFVSEAQRVNATVARLAAVAAIPAAVAEYLRGANLPLAIRVGTDPVLTSVRWSAEPALDIHTGRAEDADTTSVATAFAGIAETGTLMLLSGADTPAAASLLPETHIAIVETQRIVPFMEDAWALLREEKGSLPRAVNFVSGSSRTADIEQTVTLGAHGPYRVHIILVG